MKTTLKSIFANSGYVKEGEPYTYRIFIGSTDKSNFRYQVAKTKEYKANRTAPRPLHFDAIREYLVKHWNAEIVSGQESDDALGIAQCEAEPGTTVICSSDKDLKMIPGNHYNFVKKLKYKVCEADAIKTFYLQVLTGDSSDNIPGLSGIGPVKAAKILDGLETEDDLYYACLTAYDGDTELMHEMCRLLWIRRKEGEIWEPPRPLWDPEYLEEDSTDYVDWTEAKQVEFPNLKRTEGIDEDEELL